MKNRLKELDVDFIGGQGPLTKEEQQKISEFLRHQKMLKSRKQLAKATPVKGKKVVA